MGATVIVNRRTVVHKGSGGSAPGLPDFCKTPAPPGPPVPVPYPIVAQSSDTANGSSSVTCDGNPIMLKDSDFSRCSGDEAGTLKGVASSTNMGKAKFAAYSFDVKVEGKNVPRLGDAMTNNGNSPNTTTVAELQTAMGIGANEWPYQITDDEVKKICKAICKCKDSTKKIVPPAKKKYKHRQACVARELSSGYPLYDQKHKGMQCEQPYDLSNVSKTPPKMPELLQSTTGRTTLGGAPAGASLHSGLGQAGGRGITSCRPDIVLTHSDSMIAEGKNIRQVIEVKFKGDKLTDQQFYNYSDLNGGDPVPMVISEKDCQCGK